MSDPVFGMSITTVDGEARPAIASDMSVVGFVGTAPDANAEAFPLNTPVLVFSNNAVALTALGATGTLPDAINGVNDQLGGFQVSARVVVVRVSEGEDTDETIENIIGEMSGRTGMFALLNAGPVLGVIPRLIGVPGYTHQQQRGLASVTVSAAGSGYTSAPTVAFTGGGGSGATATAVLGTGADAEKVVGVTIINPGTGYTTAPSVSFTGGAGTGAAASATVEVLANAVCAALPPVLERLVAHAVVDGPATTLQAFTDWRETLNSRRLIPVETAVKVGVDAVVKPASPRIIGIGVRRDHEFGGLPFHSWANQPVYGIVGPNRPIDFSITDGSVEGQMILSQNGGIIVRGEMGVESAIGSGGFTYIGTDNAGEDDLWRFYNVTRGRDFIHLMFLRTLRFYLGRFNLTGQTIEAILNTMKFALRDLKADDAILGFKVGFTRDQNSPEQLRLGRFTVDFQAEEAPVLRYLGIRSMRYRPALNALLDDLLSQIDTAA